MGLCNLALYKVDVSDLQSNDKNANHPLDATITLIGRKENFQFGYE